MSSVWRKTRFNLILGLIFIFLPIVASGQDRSIRMVFAGDLMAHVPNFSIKPYDAIYDGIKFILQSSELNFVNLEFPIDNSAPYDSYPAFNVHSEYPLAAIKAGFNVFSLANNHAADRGSKGVPKTQQAMADLKKQAKKDLTLDIWFNGLRPTEKSDPYTLTIIERSGIRIGFVAIAEWVNIPVLKKWVQYADFREKPQPEAFLKWLRAARSTVDLLVLSYHWGEEYENAQNKFRVGISKILVESGVDILWGNHPHVLQPWYLLDSPRGRGLVMPSCGNFVSGQTWFLGPGDFLKNDAPKGDSMLFSTTVNIDASGRVSFPKIDPILIAAKKTVSGQMVVRTMADLVRNSDPDWRKFFQNRLSVISTMIPKSLEVSVLKGFAKPYPEGNIPE